MKCKSQCVQRVTCAPSCHRDASQRPIQFWEQCASMQETTSSLPIRCAHLQSEPPRRDTMVHLHSRPRMPCEVSPGQRKNNPSKKNNYDTRMPQTSKFAVSSKAGQQETPHAVKVSRVSFQRSLESVKRLTIHTALAEAPSCRSPRVVIVSQVLSSATARATSLVAIFSHACLASSSTAAGSDTSS